MSDADTFETLDRAYLEYSQITRARTAREIDMAATLRTLRCRLRNEPVKLSDDELLRVIEAQLDRMAT